MKQYTIFSAMITSIIVLSGCNISQISRTAWKHLSGNDAHILEYSASELPALKLNRDPPNEYVLFTDQIWGISIKIPYNPQWGTMEKYVLPYVLQDNELIFGPVKQCPPRGAPCRLNKMIKYGKQTFADIQFGVQERIRTECVTSLPCHLQNIEEIETPTVQAILYDEEGMMLAQKVDFITRNGQHFSIDLFEEREVIKKMIESIAVQE